MKKKFFIIFSVLLFVLCGATIFKCNINAKGNNIGSVSFENFSSAVMNMLGDDSLEENCDKVFYNNQDFTIIDDNPLIDAETFCEVTNSKLKLNSKGCEIQKEDKTLTINIEENILIVNDSNLYVTTIQPKLQNNNMYFSLTDVAKCLGYDVFEKQDKIIISNPYQTKRLIVSSSQNLDSKGAIKKAEGYKNLHIFEYDTEEECRNALNYYNSLNNVDWVEVDKVYSVSDIYSVNLDNKDYNDYGNIIADNNDLEDKENASREKDNLIVSNSLDVTKSSEDVTCLANSKSITSFTTWGAKAMGVEEYSNYLYSLGSLNNVVVAVLDTGLDSDHEWFTNRVAIGGKNFSTSKSSTNYEYEDAEGHGTHVAGTIVDLTFNNVKILPVKVMNDNGLGATSNIILGLHYVIDLKNGDIKISGVDTSYFNNIIAMNLSLGGSSVNYNAYNTALTNAYNSGILPVVAAGNDGEDVVNTSPANVECAITVSAIGKAGENNYYRPYWSNWGEYIDVCAPGEDIKSACVGGGVISMDGTSMASPHIAGIVALLYSSGEFSFSVEGAKSVTSLIKNNAIDLGTSGWDNYFGEGLANVSYAYAVLLEDNVAFSVTEINHTEKFNLNLSSKTSNGNIYYTTDGTEPNLNNSTLYSSSIEINKTVMIRARIIVLDEKENVVSFSKVSNQIYIINNQDIDNAYTVLDSGELISYNGLLSNVTVPEYYNNIQITSIGERAFISANPEYVTLPSSVKTIGRYGFYGCSNLKKVVGTGVTKIGLYAFYFDENLLSVTDNEFPELLTIDKYAFTNCVSLQQISLSKVTLVDYYAFCNNAVVAEDLILISLPNVVTIGDFAFYGTESLTQVYLPNVEFIGAKTFTDCDITSLNLPKVKYIGLQCFENNKNLTFASMPNLLFVGTQCFYNCKQLSSVNVSNLKYISALGFASTGLESIDIPLVESVGVEAFNNCTSLVSLNASSLKYIKLEAFYNCTSLEKVDLPNVISIERNAFFNIRKVTSVTLSPCIEYISNVAFHRLKQGCIFYIYANTPAKQFVLDYILTNGEIISFEEIEDNQNNFEYEIVNGEVYLTGLKALNVTEIEIPSFIENLPVTKICENAFRDNKLITDLTLTNVLNIEKNAFNGCTNLTNLYVKDLEIIGDSAFSGCTSLSEIYIPNVKTIGNYAFYDCQNLKQIKLGQNITSIGKMALGYINNNSLNEEFTLFGYEGIASTYATNNNIKNYHNIFEDLKSYYYNYYINNGEQQVYISLVNSYITGGVIIPSTCVVDNKTYKITKIGDSAFENCYLITDIKLPSSITTLGNYAFYNCTNLRNINLNYVTNLGAMCFSRCENLQSVNIEKVEEIKVQTFAFCYNLKEVELPQVTTINDQAFYFCIALESVICPNLQTIRYGGFSNCYRLNNINLNSVVTLGSLDLSDGTETMFTGSVFENCYNLGEFVYLNNVKELGALLFNGSNVKNVVIGRKFDTYIENTSYKPTDDSIIIYGYLGSYAQTYANKNLFTFKAIDDFSMRVKSNLNITCLENDECILEVEAKGFNLKYQWYSYNDNNGVKIENQTNSTFLVETTITGIKKFYVEVINWDDEILSSQIITVTVLPGFQILLEYNEDEGKIISSVGDRVNSGSDVTYTFLAFEGHYITAIFVDGVKLNDEEMQVAIKNGYTFNNVLADHNIKVEFGIYTYIITITYGENGEVYDANNMLIENGTSIEVKFNETPLFIFKAKQNYHAEQVILDDIDLGRKDRYLFNGVKDNHTLQVNFDINKYKITLRHNNFGQVEALESLTEIYDGENRTFTISVEEGCYIESIKCNGVSIPVEDNTFTISNIHSDIDLEINFKKINPDEDNINHINEVIIFAGIIIAVLVIIFAPVLMFRKKENKKF